MDDSMVLSQDSPPPSAFFTTPCRDMGIDALGRVTSKILAEVQTLIGATTQPPGSNHADLLHSLHAAFGQGRAIIGGLMNAAAPIHRMPPELLTKIFALSPRTIMHRGINGRIGKHLAYWPFKAEDDVRDMHKLTEVCRYWRDLAIATPMLWTTIRLGSGEHRGVSESDDFRGNVYCPSGPHRRIGFIVHVDLGRPYTHKILDSMLRHSTNIRELHVWDMACITKDVFLFWRSFDASALEHCTLWDDDRLSFHHRLTSNSIPFFFTNGGARLRSLCLSNFTFHVFPPNAFPALTLLVASASKESRVTMGDLFKFLAGCPRLEELYIYNIQRDPFHTSTTSSLPISLPRLQYLYYAYRRHQDSGWEEDQDPVEHLLRVSSTSIPHTCHMYFSVDNKPYMGVTDHDILDSVCRHVQGKDAISHVFLWLIGKGQSTMQLVFRQGSLRLQFGTHFECVGTLDSLHGRFSRTEDVRVCYPSAGSYTKLVMSLHHTLPRLFPSLKVLLLVRRGPDDLYLERVRLCGYESPSRSVAIAVHLLHDYLTELPASSRSPSLDSEAEVEAEHVPWHPALDTLWVSVGSQEEIIPLQETLARRAGLGFPIRCVVVHHCFEGDSPALARLQALDGVEEVILMKTRAADVLREGDWAVGLPDMFSLPATIRRDWPTVWYGNRDDYGGR